MMFLNILRMLLPVLLFLKICYASEEFEPEGDSVILTDSVVNIMTMRTTARVEKGDSNIYTFFNFDNKCPNYFYEIKHEEKKIIFTFNNTRLGIFLKEDTVHQANIGPIKKIYLQEQLKNKNEDMAGLIPEWYYLVNVVIECDPVVNDQKSLEIVEKDEVLSIQLKWPRNKFKRKEIYYSGPEKKHPSLVLTLTGIGAAGLAGGGVLLYYLLNNNDNSSDILQPVLPEHSSP